jgi:NitT/TauT family transport system substrate-binding protein
VARDEGLFAEEKLEVELVRTPKRSGRATENPNLVNSTDVHQLFELGQAQFHRGCEWGQIRRAYDSNCGGLIVSKRAAVVSQAIMVRPDSPFIHAQDLRNVPVAVHFHAGSHYLTLQMLEGFLPRAEIKVIHMPVTAHRCQALFEGKVGAITVAEPWISLAEKQRCKLIAEAYCVGSEVAAPDVDAKTHAAIERAIKKAVRFINADKKKYLHYIIADVPPELGSLTREDFHLPRLRYVDPVPYYADEFHRAYEWMLSWNLIPPDATFEQIVDSRVSLASS